MEAFQPALQFFNTLIIYPLINLLVAIYDILLAFHIPYAFGFAIIGLTIVLRIILYPLMNKQLRASKKMQDVAPHISNVKEKHKGDNKRIQEETMKLYKEHGVNPMAGCLPTLIQLPLLLGLYQVLNKLVKLDPDQMVAYVNSIVITPLADKRTLGPNFFWHTAWAKPSTADGNVTYCCNFYTFNNGTVSIHSIKDDVFYSPISSRI